MNWPVWISEDVMAVDPERGVPAPLGSDGFGPLLASHAASSAGGSVVTLTTTPRATVAEAVAEARLLRIELAGFLRERHGLAAVAMGTHPWSETSAPPSAGCGLRIAVGVPDPDTAARALDGLRAQAPLLLAVAANSPFWRGRDTGLASTRAMLRLGSADWDARPLPRLGAVEVTVMDSQTRLREVAGVAALVQCLTRVHAEHAPVAVEPEVVLANRSAALKQGLDAELIDASGAFAKRAVDELALRVEGCVPAACALDCARELAGVKRNATDPGYARQRSIAASAGLEALVHELGGEFEDVPVAA